MTPSQSEGLDGCEQPQGLPGLKFKSPLRIRHPRPILEHRAVPGFRMYFLICSSSNPTVETA
jgi:hypothetical protein